jgi:hypothetical protein
VRWESKTSCYATSPFLFLLVSGVFFYVSISLFLFWREGDVVVCSETFVAGEYDQHDPFSTSRFWEVSGRES